MCENRENEGGREGGRRERMREGGREGGGRERKSIERKSESQMVCFIWWSASLIVGGLVSLSAVLPI